MLYYIRVSLIIQIRDFVQAGSQSGDWEPEANIAPAAKEQYLFNKNYSVIP